MFRKNFYVTAALAAALTLILATGCDWGSDDSPSGNLTTGVDDELLQYYSLVQEVAPPPYIGPSFMGSIQFIPMPEDSFWLGGTTPWIGKAFGSSWPTSLYTNIADLDDMIELINFGIENGAGTHIRVVGSDSTEITVAVTELTETTTVPLCCQTLMNTQGVDLDIYIKLTIADDPEYEIHAGYTITSTNQTLMVYKDCPAESITRKTSLYLVSTDVSGDNIDVYGAFYAEYDTDVEIGLVYKLNTVSANQFQYGMSYYGLSEAFDFSAVEALAGGGNKDDEFVMRRAQFIPATNDLENPHESVISLFGPDYVYIGSDVPTELQDFVSNANLYLFEDIPTAWIDNPWVE